MLIYISSSKNLNNVLFATFNLVLEVSYDTCLLLLDTNVSKLSLDFFDIMNYNNIDKSYQP